MPQKIQRAPRGFLSLLGLYGGNSPGQLNDILQPVVDLTALYGSDRLSSTAVSAAVAAPSSPAALTVTVPTGDAWLLTSCGLNTGAVGATGSNARIAVNIGGLQGNNPNARVWGSDTWTSITTADRISFGFLFPQPIVLIGGRSVSVSFDIWDTSLTAEFEVTFWDLGLG